ncbi:bifunctional folylpolyglutamate synthase/dihydrofolate synthase [Siminovitchia sediminis]|uniref:tetrahydrofolate synthase n=1 Tax=Siminovitchia sediminis TaxID=1274353 RepID=A0ABW4KEY5_9BACI
MNTYSEAVSWIHSRLKHGINPGLARMEWLMKKMGSPEKDLRVIHVAGTNGKGSTVTFLRSVLQEAGYDVGTFTSPYIETFNERISLNGVPVSNKDIVELVKIVKPLTEEMEKGDLGSPTEFEVITAMAIYYFANIRKPDFTLLEVGLGGRYDSTNVVHPLITLITNIGMDHMRILGDTMEEIAFEKAGIIKQGIPVFTGAKQEAARTVIQSEADRQKADLFQLGRDFKVEYYKPAAGGEQFTFQSRWKRLDQLQISMLGRHQTDNAALAVAGLQYMNARALVHVTEENMRDGLAKAHWPGRMEIVHEHPTVILDGAHNAEGLQAFAATMKCRYKEKKLKIIFAALEDKDLSSMLDQLNQIHAEIYLTQFDFPRAASAIQLKEAGNMEHATVDEDWRRLVKNEVHRLDSDDILAITGSLYFISEAKPLLIKLLMK